MSEVLWTELEKIDVLRERLGVTYEEARKALSEAEGDVLKALADLEKGFKNYSMDLKGKGQQLWGSLQEKFNELNGTKVSLKRNNKTILSVSAPIGLAVAYSIWRRPGLRLLGLAGVAGLALKDYELEIDRVQGNSYMGASHPHPRETAFAQTEMGI